MSGLAYVPETIVPTIFLVVIVGCSLERERVTGSPSIDGGLQLVDAGSDAPVVEDDGGTPVEDAGGDRRRLDLFAGGGFTRATEGSFLRSAPTNGASGFLAWAPPGTRRIEDRGDGLGPMLLVEGSSRNLVEDARDITASTWSASGAITTADDGPGPDGAALADRSQVPTSNSNFFALGLPAAGTVLCASVWARRPPSAGPGRAQVVIQDTTAGSGSARSVVLTETYARIDVCHLASGRGLFYIPGHASAGYDGVTIATPLDFVSDLHQVERAAFPSSAIGPGGVRDADVLVYAVDQYPAALRAGLRLEFAPDFSSIDLLTEGDGTTRVVMSFGRSSDAVVLRNRSGVVEAAAFVDGGIGGMIATSGPVSWARGDLLTFEVRPSALTLRGFDEGDGTFAATTALVWPISPLRIAGSDGCSGRVGRYLTAID